MSFMLLPRCHGCILSSQVTQLRYGPQGVVYPPGHTMARGSTPAAHLNASRTMSGGSACAQVCAAGSK